MDNDENGEPYFVIIYSKKTKPKKLKNGLGLLGTSCKKEMCFVFYFNSGMEISILLFLS